MHNIKMPIQKAERTQAAEREHVKQVVQQSVTVGTTNRKHAQLTFTFTTRSSPIRILCLGISHVVISDTYLVLRHFPRGHLRYVSCVTVFPTWSSPIRILCYGISHVVISDTYLVLRHFPRGHLRYVICVSAFPTWSSPIRILCYGISHVVISDT